MSAADTPEGHGLRHSPWLAAVELVLVVACLVADRYGVVPLSNTPWLLALGWASLRVRRLRWHDLGFTRPRSWMQVLAVGGAIGLAMELLAVYGTEPFIAQLVGQPPDVSDFRPLVGNLKFLGIALVLNWSLAAFGEELVYRGYLMNRLAGLGHGTRAAWTASLLAVTILFGCAHGESQGLAGIVQEAWNGLLLGLLYLAAGRRLAYPIVAHGVSNTLAFVLIYHGRYPGL